MTEDIPKIFVICKFDALSHCSFVCFIAAHPPQITSKISFFVPPTGKHSQVSLFFQSILSCKKILAELA